MAQWVKEFATMLDDLSSIWSPGLSAVSWKQVLWALPSMLVRLNHNSVLFRTHCSHDWGTERPCGYSAVGPENPTLREEWAPSPIKFFFVVIPAPTLGRFLRKILVSWYLRKSFQKLLKIDSLFLAFSFLVVFSSDSNDLGFPRISDYV